MAQLGYTINQNDLPEDQGDFSPIPAGEYHVKVNDAEICNTKAGNGQYIKLRLDVVGPSHQGRVIFSNINIQNASQKAEEIGRQQLGAIMRAINLPALQDTDQLIGGELVVKVSIRKSEEYGDQNEVKSYKAIGGSAAPAPSQPAQSGEQQPAASGKPPWAK